MISKKAQEISVWVWMVVIMSLFILAPIMLKVVTTSISGVATSINSTSPLASETGTRILGVFTNFWDSLIVFAFLISTLLLFVSAFFIDTHTAFVIIYIISALLLILMTPALSSVALALWQNPEFVSEASSMPFTEFLLQHIEGITLSIIILSGIITYAKFKYFSSQWQ